MVLRLSEFDGRGRVLFEIGETRRKSSGAILGRWDFLNTGGKGRQAGRVRQAG